MLERYAKKILSARVYDVARVSSLDAAPNLSARVGNQVFLKREDQQSVFSFKLRGAYNKMAGLTVAERERGVVTASAGNHAQGVALAARALKIDATIVMGVTTPSIKINAVRARGARVVLHGDGYDAAAGKAREIGEQEGRVYVHPFDDPDIIAGQGTVGMEILAQHPDALDAIFVPVGGGGLVAGIAAYVKYLRPAIKIIGVEAEGSACLAAALQAGRRVRLPADTLDLFADGVSVAQVGKAGFEVARRYVDEVVVASTDQICAAIKDVFDDTRVVAEPAGALAVAGLKAYVERHAARDQTLVAVVSGANVNFDRLRYISERAEIGEAREAVFAVTIPEEVGSFRRFCRTLGKRNVTEFNYRYAPGQAAQVFVGLQLGGQGDREKTLAGIAKRYPVADLTDDELAKTHVRHMVGGRASIPNEHVFRFEFPERPGALRQFLDVLAGRWNISMFHYRNHGAAWGRVLVGFQIAPAELGRFADNVGELGYRYWEETDNSAYVRFLRGTDLNSENAS